jgi:hypothetical protein
MPSYTDAEGNATWEGPADGLKIADPTPPPVERMTWWRPVIRSPSLALR